MKKDEIKVTEDENIEELKPEQKTDEDSSQKLQLSNIGNAINDIKDMLEEREDLAEEALIEEVEVEEPEPESKSSVLRWVIVGTGVTVLGFLAYSTFSGKIGTVSHTVGAVDENNG